jgi:hypothetical protein
MKIIFQISTMMHETDGYWKLSNYDNFLLHYNMHSPNINEKMKFHKE